MTTPASPPPGTGPELAARIRGDLVTLERELAEIEMLIGQAKTESVRHEQKRAQAAERLATPDPRADPAEVADAYGQLVNLTRRAVLMDAQADLLEGKRKSLARHRDALAAVAAALEGMPDGVLASGAVAVAPGSEAQAMSEDEGAGGEEPLPPTLSRVVLSAQEDLRREIARSMHDGPAQSLTNIVLQAQIVDRLLSRDPAEAKSELGLLVSMVQQTLDATKNFIFDVRPMVLDDLGLMPTLRRAARDRGRRAHVPVEFDSLGHDRRLPMEVESTVFRIVDEALGAYLGLGPERMLLRLDWTEELEVRLSAFRTAVMPAGEPLPEIPTGDVPDAIRQMIQERHDARQAAIEAAEVAALVVLPASIRRDVADRAASIGGSVEILEGGTLLRLVVPLPTGETPEPA